MTATPTAHLLSIGEELLEGRILDRNAARFAARLLELGFRVVGKTTVGDEPGALRHALDALQGRADVILSTGGLGPTTDDRVRAEVAEALGVALVANPEVEARLTLLYQSVQGSSVPDSFLAQARVPHGAKLLPNSAGTALGFAFDWGGGRVLCLPGPPVECEATFEGGGGLQDLAERFPDMGRVAHGLFHTVGVPEAVVESQIRDLMEPTPSRRLGITASASRVTISVVVLPSSDGRTAEEELAEVAGQLRQRLGVWLVAEGDSTLEQEVVAALQDAGQTVATAESCTGGRLAAALTSVPGSSRVFPAGFVVYSNEAKVRDLGVDLALLEKHGAVSAEVALALAEGARTRVGADWGISATGIAGPEGGTGEKPVGTVFLGLAGPEDGHALLRQQWIRAGREAIQDQTVRDALETLRRAVLGLPPLPEKPAFLADPPKRA